MSRWRIWSVWIICVGVSAPIWNIASCVNPRASEVQSDSGLDGRRSTERSRLEILSRERNEREQRGERVAEKSIPKAVTLQEGIFSIKIEPNPWTLSVHRGAQLLVTLPLEGLQLGVVSEFDEDYNYDPHWLSPIHGQAANPPELKWLQPTAVILQKSDSKSATYRLSYKQKIACSFMIKVHAKGSFFLEWKPTSKLERAVYKRIRWKVSKTENYYGLGEYLDQVAHRGMIRAMQIEVDTKLESSYNEAHVPVPFFTGTKAWGLFVKSYHPGTFDMGRKDPEVIEVTYHAPDLEMYLFVAKDPLAIPGLYTRITGAPAIPARWAFGTLLWRNENKNQAEVLEDAANIRKHDLAISGLWIDRPYDVAVNDFGFDTKRYPAIGEMIQKLNETGFRLGVWSTPYLELASKNFALFKRNDWFVKRAVKTNSWGDPVDLTNPAAFKAWQGLIDKMIKLGIQGFKLDYGEDIQLGFRAGRLRYKFHNGEDERTMHHKYNLFYHKAYYERLPKNDGFLICRGGTFGTQVYTTIVWPGDLDADFRKHRQCDGNKCHVGGLIASIIAGVSLSQSGFPFYGADTGGYRHERPSKEVMMRWGQQTALSTIMQIGGPDPNANPWDFTKYGPSLFDQEVLDMYRRYIRLHTRLFPYIYTYAMAAQHHLPGPTRPYGMMFPEEHFDPNDIYFLGDFLMVAPVVASATKRSIRFPKSYDWVDWWDQKVYKGGSTVSYNAPLDRLPLFLRVGSIIPMLRPDVDTLASSKDPNVVSSHGDPGNLYLRIVPGRDVSLKLYDETSISFKQGAMLSISLKKGKEFKQGTVIEMLRLASVSQVMDGSKVLQKVPDAQAFSNCSKGCWRWDEVGKRLWIRVPSTDHEISIQSQIP